MTEEAHRAIARIEEVYQQGRKARRDGKTCTSPLDVTPVEREWWRRGWTAEDHAQARASTSLDEIERRYWGG